MINGHVVKEVMGAAMRVPAAKLHYRGARVVTNLRVVPILSRAAIVAGTRAINGTVRLVRYFALRTIARPAASITFFVSP